MILCTSLEIAVITHPEKFKNVQQARVKQKLRKNALRAIKDVAYILDCYGTTFGTIMIGTRQAEGQPKKDNFTYTQKRNSKPSKYTDEILTSPEFRYLMSKAYEGAQTEVPSARALAFASQQFYDAFDAIFRAVPNVFQKPLRNSLQQFMDIFNAVVNNEKAKGNDVKIPKLKVPSALDPYGKNSV
ncbi:MAG: hypothetical protein EX285_06150 [Thaumarchaeota archaeon]|nr:hypothetical protein [Nitrososphaerota archaeon]